MENSILIPFIQHGFRKSGIDQGKQISGYCPLCLSEYIKAGKQQTAKMVINEDTGQWDCKVCMRSGNSKSFLPQLIDVCEKAFTPETAKPLLKIKGLKYETFKNARTGYNVANDTFIFPLFTTDNKIHDVRIYRIGEKVISTKGCTVGLRGWENFDRSGEVWITEGESDYFTAVEAFTHLKLFNDIIVSIPGAGTFKAEWIGLFQGKKVNVLMDNDDAGKKGAIRIFNKLSTVATLKFIHWGNRKSGYDTRDLYIEKGRIAQAFYDELLKGLKDMPVGFNPDEVKGVSVVKPAEEKLSRIRIPAVKAYEAYRKWLHIEDDHILDVLFGTLIANRLQGDPLWVFIVAPPGGMKTELLMSLDTSPRIYTTTSLTPASLVSGMNVGGNIDPSIIPRLNNRVLIVKDFTTILKLPPMIRDEIFGIFRDAYDGKTEKQFGNGVMRKYISHFGVVAGVTPAIYFHTEDNSVLGERFLIYNIKSSARFDKRMEMVERALMNVTKEDSMRKELSEAAKSVLSYDYTKSPIPVVSPEIRKRFIYLAQFATILRAAVIRDRYTKEVTHKPFIEIATRVAKQFMKLSLGIAYFRGDRVVTEKHCEIVRDIAIGTVPHKTEEAFERLYKRFGSNSFSLLQATEIIGLPQSTSERIIDDLKYLKVLNRIKAGGFSMVYSLTDEFKQILEGGKIYG